MNAPDLNEFGQEDPEAVPTQDIEAQPMPEMPQAEMGMEFGQGVAKDPVIINK